MSKDKIVLSAWAGFVVGISAGILFAPVKGYETQYHMMDMGEAYVEQLSSKLNEEEEPIAVIYSNMNHLTNTLVNKGKATYAEPKTQFRNVASDPWQGSS